MAYKSVIRYF